MVGYKQERIKSCKLLGVHIDEYLNWDDHIKHMVLHNLFGPCGDKKRRLSEFLANRVSCLYFIIPSQIITCESRVTFTCLRNYVNFTRVNIIGAMSGRFRSTCTFTHGLSHSGSIIFTRVKFTCVRTYITRQWKSTLKHLCERLVLN